MLERGVYLAPSQYEVTLTPTLTLTLTLTPDSLPLTLSAHPEQAGFMSLAHTEEDIDRTIAMAKEVFAII